MKHYVYLFLVLHCETYFNDWSIQDMNKFITNNSEYFEVIYKIPDYEKTKLGEGNTALVYSKGDQSIKIINFYYTFQDVYNYVILKKLSESDKNFPSDSLLK